MYYIVNKVDCVIQNIRTCVAVECINYHILVVFFFFKIRKNQSSSNGEEVHSHSSANDYVKSLHQNSKSTLLYGKNNVFVQPWRS